jgi:hypothetical protein
MRRGDDYVTKISRTLSAHGITSWHFERTRRHRAVRVTHGGRTITVTFPSSGSDWRGARNATADLRRALRRTAL